MKTGKRSTGSVRRQEIGGQGRLHRRRTAALLGAGELLEDRRLLAVSLDMAPVGNPGNVADTTGYGAVAYPYQIGKHEVTIGQYAEFLNAVAKTDTYGLYATGMASNYGGVGITRSGSSGAYSYTVNTVSTFAYGPTTVGPNLPITDVNWFDAARFANWMANGQPTGAQGNTTTEQGAYALAGATSGNTVARSSTNPNTGVAPTFFIPTENEWYKAAYYSPALNGGSGGYFTYATRSNSYPGNSSTTGASMANVNTGVYATSQQAELVSGVVYMTNVGLYANSGSFYGTFDQSGNVTELSTLAGGASPNVAMRGGNWTATPSAFSDSGNRSEVGTTFATYNIGFRLAAPATAPGQPTGLSGAPGAGQVSLTWNAPASNGGSLITDYVVEYKTTAAATWTTFADGVSTTPAAIVTGLTNGTSYVFRVSAKNEAGTGNPTAASASVTPRTVPGQPASLSGSPGDARATLTWSAGSSGGATVTDYVVQYKTVDAIEWTTFADGVSTNRYATVTGLTNTVDYVFRVAAVNAAGTGAFTAASAVLTPAGAPNAPTGVVASAQRGYAVVSWTAPVSDGGAPISGYVVESSRDGGATWVHCATAGATVRLLRVDGISEPMYDGATYTFRVKATNALGTGAASVPSAAVTLPRQPGWPVRGGGTGDDAARSVATAGSATLVTGSFSGTAMFGDTTLTAAGDADVFVAKLNADGSYAWAVRAGGAGADQGAKITAFDDGSTVVIGSFAGSAAFGGTTLTAVGSDTFIAKVRADGTFAWARRTGTAGSPTATHVAGLAGGEVIVTGAFSGSATFDGTTLVARGVSDAFVAKLGAGGSYAWAVRAGAPIASSANVSPGGIATLSDGSSYVAGWFRGQVAFGGTTPVSSRSAVDRSIFVARVSPSGAFEWVRQADPATWSTASTSQNEVTDVAVLGDRVLVTGTFTDNLTIGEANLSGQRADIFLGEWSADGASAAAINVGGVGDDFGGRLFTDGFSALVTGTFDTAAWVYPQGFMPNAVTQIQGASTTQAFVARYSSFYLTAPGGQSGYLQWATTIPDNGPGLLTAADVTESSAGRPVVVGRFTQAAVFGTTQLSIAGAGDVFVARMSSAGGFDFLAGPPTDVTGIPGDGRVSLTWQPPASTNGLVSDYLVEYSSDGGLTWSTFGDGVSTTTAATVTGLANDTAYRFRVSTVNDAGIGRPSALSALMTPTLVRPAGFPRQAVGGSADSLTVFPDGSAAVTGYFTGSGVFGNTTVTGTNPQVDGGTFAARLAADGAFSWAREAPGSIAAAAAGGATLVAGTELMEYPAAYDPMSGMTRPSFSATHMVVTQLKADGSTGWRSSEGATPPFSPGLYPQPGDGSEVRPQAMTTLPDGSVVVAGMRNDYYSSYGSTMNPPVFFLRKINADGSFGWGQSSSSSTMYSYYGSDTVTSLTAFSDGSTLMAGRSSNELPFGSSGPSPSPSPSSRAFVAKFAANGTVAWSRQLGEYIDPMMPPGYSSYMDVNVAGMTTLPDGSAIVAGSFSGQVTFDTTTLYAADFSDGFIVKLAADGTVVWAQSLDVGVNGITTLTDGSALATGSFAGSLTVGTETLTSAGDSDAFIFKVASNGSFIWARRAGGAGWDGGGKIAALADGSALVAGRFSGTAAFGSASLTSVAATDTFIAKIGADGTFVVPGAATTITVGTGQTVADTTVRTGTAQLVKQGVGTLILDLANSHSGGTVVEAGDVVVRNTAALGTGPMTVKPGARLMLDVGPQSVPLAGLQIQGGGLLDVGTGRIVLGAGTFDLAAIRGQLAAGHGAGTGPGATGIASSTAAATPGRAVGHVFDGDGNLVVGFAAAGDLDMNGLVDLDDVIAFVSGGLYDAGLPAVWSQGDYDYNGIIDLDDVIAFVGGGLYDQGSYLPAAAPAVAQSFAQFSPQSSAESFAVSNPPADAEPVAAAKEGFDPAAAAFASLAAEQQATGDPSARKKQTVRVG